ncbi:hypothetical protein [Companilactobacillus tucceti]|uniref:hypothetical protein n=1 Tax=Companilactobacillus tucceti TaxID=238012 RepID=UPI000708E265|nr:hypothetical protein [Companilactobacillus tucceti]
MEHMSGHQNSFSDIAFILIISLVIIFSWMLINFGAPKASFELLFKAIDFVLASAIFLVGIKFNHEN